MRLTVSKKNECQMCRGKFGLVRHTHGVKQFCSNKAGKACKERYIQAKVEEIRRRMPPLLRPT